MPWWPFRRKVEWIGATPTFELEQRANAAFNAQRWAEAARLYGEVVEKADREGRQVARNRLGEVYERQKRVQDAIAVYEAAVVERSPYGFPYQRLCIIYHRLGQIDEEERVLHIALRVKMVGDWRSWFVARLAKRQGTRSQ